MKPKRELRLRFGFLLSGVGDYHHDVVLKGATLFSIRRLTESVSNNDRIRFFPDLDYDH